MAHGNLARVSGRAVLSIMILTLVSVREGLEQKGLPDKKEERISVELPPLPEGLLQCRLLLHVIIKLQHSPWIWYGLLASCLKHPCEAPCTPWAASRRMPACSIMACCHWLREWDLLSL